MVQHSDGTFTGVDYENGDSFDVERASLLVCKLNLRKLADRVTESLGGRIDYQAPAPSDKTHRIGRLPPKLASAPLYLCVRTNQDALLAACASLAGATGSVILVPTLSHASIDVDALADQFRTLLVAMDDLLLCSVNGWECDPYVLEELRNRLGVGDCTNANSFRLVGEAFATKLTQTAIAKLLRNANRVRSNPPKGTARNPDTGRCSQTFVMAGKADAIVQRSDGMYLVEHKTAASIDSNYLDKLWTDTQIALYCYRGDQDTARTDRIFVSDAHQRNGRGVTRQAQSL